ncbi:MAG: hypothetical protein AAB638_00885 [Patescibacteria group bacterium]
MEIHIGNLIRDRADGLRIMPAELGRLINKSRQNVNDIFTRKTIDTDQLLAISKALNYNFFKIYTALYKGAYVKVKKVKLEGSDSLMGQLDIGKVEEVQLDYGAPDSEDLLAECEKERDTLAEKYRIQTENASNQQKYIKMLEEKVAMLSESKPTVV